MKKLEVFVNVGVIVLGAVILFFLVKTYRATQSASRPSLEPHVGDQLPAIPGVDWKANDRTLVLALKKGCHYCEDSMPFYRRLSELSEQKALKANLVAVFPDPVEDVDALVKAQHLSLQAVPSFPLPSLRVPGTPTMILADSSGRVLQDWIGLLSDRQQQELIDALQVEKAANAASASASAAANCDSRKPCDAQ
jgi:thioredoxin-related protein